MKCVKRLTADQQRLAEENLTIVERVLRFDINANPCFYSYHRSVDSRICILLLSRSVPALGSGRYSTYLPIR